MRGRGLGPERIEEIVIEEWRRRGIAPPTGLAMERTVDEIGHPPSVAEQVRVQAGLATDLLGLPLRLRRATRGGLNQLLRRVNRHQGKVFEIAVGAGQVPVRTGPSSALLLKSLASQAVFLPSLMRVTNAELRTGAEGSVEVWTYSAEQDTAERSVPIGTIEGPEALPFGHYIAIAELVGQPCICRATLVASRDGGWQMLVGRPLEH